jgi:hypothetical protein
MGHTSYRDSIPFVIVCRFHYFASAVAAQERSIIMLEGKYTGDPLHYYYYYAFGL